MEQVKEFIKNKKYIIIFIAVLTLSIITRIFRLSDLPHGINVDEAGMAYDAYCLSNYGTDRYLNHMPVYLINFGDGQSVLYAYVASIFIKLFGFNIFAIRLPAVLFGIIAIVLCYFMTRKSYGEKFALTFMVLVTICPWHIMSTRWGLDCNLLAPMIIISIFFISRAEKIVDYVIAGIAIGITLYTYSLSYLILPIFLSLLYIYVLYIKKSKIKELIAMTIPAVLLAIPLFLLLLVNYNVISEIRGFITIPKLWFFRVGEISFSNIKDNLFFFISIFTNDSLVYNALPEFGTIYFFEIFLSIFGIVIVLQNFAKNISRREFKIEFLMLFIIFSIYFCMLLIINPNINKANGIYIPLLFFVCIALRHIYRYYKVLFYIIIGIYIVCFCAFTVFYFNYYEQKYEYQPQFESDLIEALDFVQKNYNDKKVCINTSSKQPWIYTLVYNPISPYDFYEQRTEKQLDKYDFSYGKYNFQKKRIEQDTIYIIKDNQNLVEKLEKKRIYQLCYKKLYNMVFSS